MRGIAEEKFIDCFISFYFFDVGKSRGIVHSLFYELMLYLFSAGRSREEEVRKVVCFMSSCTVTKSDSFLEGHSKFPAQSLKTFVSDTGKIYTLSKAFFLPLLSGKLFHSGECAFFHL